MNCPLVQRYCNAKNGTLDIAREAEAAYQVLLGTNSPSVRIPAGHLRHYFMGAPNSQVVVFDENTGENTVSPITKTDKESIMRALTECLVASKGFWY